MKALFDAQAQLEDGESSPDISCQIVAVSDASLTTAGTSTGPGLIVTFEVWTSPADALEQLATGPYLPALETTARDLSSAIDAEQKSDVFTH